MLEWTRISRQLRSLLFVEGLRLLYLVPETMLNLALESGVEFPPALFLFRPMFHESRVSSFSADHHPVDTEGFQQLQR